MKKLMFLLMLSCTSTLYAQSPVGNWKIVSHLGTFEGKTFDSHVALLTHRPCAAKIVYRITEDGNYRLDASASGCDEAYKNIQQRLWAKTKWKLNGNKISTSATNFAVSNDYTVSFSGNRMTWKNEYDVIIYQRLE